ncbi:hypothetical protein [Limnoglobus roseus]|uniref:Uncharacterized protein n=1 Tax=Limnoglobus roseus TaxID=2598579 RepID=A0A5C1AS36_9BACT|nr:hypothetical protein [Limnoglobus roseus]QEL20846.1 hypothetical protein PX52LOC_07966 [Limnoglobus roseus]
MKLTGTILLIVGIVAGLFTAFQYLTGATMTHAPEAPNAAAIPMMQFLFAGILLVSGALLTVYGGTGIIRTRNPAVRN